MIQRSAKWLVSGDGAVLLVREEEGRRFHACRWSAGGLVVCVPIGIAMGGWDAAVDSAGKPWIVWSDQSADSAAEVYVVRFEGESWSPRLQVSVGGVNTQPGIAPDEYGNVWVMWHRSPGDELWMCRMGPRSGRECLVARNAGSGPVSLASREGRVYAAYIDSYGDLCAVEGTENEGFHRPVDLG